MLQTLRQMLCTHQDSVAYRKYGEFAFVEYCDCAICGKTLRRIAGFDEDMRG
jgi:hypothetical protein